MIALRYVWPTISRIRDRRRVMGVVGPIEVDRSGVIATYWFDYRAVAPLARSGATALPLTRAGGADDAAASLDYMSRDADRGVIIGQPVHQRLHRLADCAGPLGDSPS